MALPPGGGNGALDGAAGPPAASASGAPRPGGDPQQERELVRRAQAGDVAAFERLLAPVMRPAHQLAVRLLGDPHLAEDVAQEAFTKAFLGMRHFRGEARFGTWIFRIVHNACTDALRHRARRPQVPVAFGEPEVEGGPVAAPVPADPAPGPEDEVIERAGRRAILEAVAGLPLEHRVVVVLRDVQGLSYEEISAVTRQNLGTVKSRLHRARATLRTALRGLAPGSEPLGAAGVQTGAIRESGAGGVSEGG